MENSELRSGIVSALAGVTARPHSVEVGFSVIGDPFIRVDFSDADMHWSPNVAPPNFLTLIELPREEIDRDPAKFLAWLKAGFAEAVGAEGD